MRSLLKKCAFVLSSLILVAPSLLVGSTAFALPPVINEFPESSYHDTIQGAPESLTVGADGQFWMNRSLSGEVDRVNTSGAITNSYNYDYGFGDHSILGNDGNIWASIGGGVSKVSNDGQRTNYFLPDDGQQHNLWKMAIGPDGAIWATDNNIPDVFRVSTDGTFTKFEVPNTVTHSDYVLGGIVTGNDGNLWLTDSSDNRIYKMTTDGDFTEYQLSAPNFVAYDIVNGSDGALWFTEGNPNSTIGRITTDGSISQVPAPISNPNNFIVGPDGNFWFETGYQSGDRILSIIASFDTSGQLVQQYQIPIPADPSYSTSIGGFVVGSDNNIWFVGDNHNYNGYNNITKPFIGQLNLNPPAVPGAPTNLSAVSPTQTAPVLSWDAMDGSVSYNIYRNGTKIDSSNTNIYTDNTAILGNTYTYYVTAANLGGESPASNSLNVAFASARQLTYLDPAKIWVGLKNSDDVGVKFDLKAEVYKDASLVTSGEIDTVAAGSSGFNNAKLDTIAFSSFSPVEFPSGSQLKLVLYVRNACTGSGHNSGTARLWYNDSVANSRFGATINATDNTYYALDGFNLGTSAGSTKKTIDVAAGAKCSAFKPFGTWSITP